MNFLNLGYYIVESVTSPKHLNLNCKQVLTATDCICNLHPSLTGSFWRNHEKEQSEYQQLLGLADKEFAQLKETVSHLYSRYELSIDSRFSNRLDALLFFEKYLYNIPDLNIISIALEDIFKDVFIEETDDKLGDDLLKNQEIGGNFLGYDILGWDFSGFHSYLCNGLNEDIVNKYTLELNDYGLIQNQYQQVKEFAKYIKDKGEPVTWLPFAIYSHRIK